MVAHWRELGCRNPLRGGGSWRPTGGDLWRPIGGGQIMETHWRGWVMETHWREVGCRGPLEGANSLKLIGWS